MELRFGGVSYVRSWPVPVIQALVVAGILCIGNTPLASPDASARRSLMGRKGAAMINSGKCRILSVWSLDFMGEPS
jgi:hypothetical protein